MDIQTTIDSVQSEENAHETRVWSGNNIPLATHRQRLNALVVKPKSSGSFEAEKLIDFLSMNPSSLQPGPPKARETSYWNSEISNSTSWQEDEAVVEIKSNVIMFPRSWEHPVFQPNVESKSDSKLTYVPKEQIESAKIESEESRSERSTPQSTTAAVELATISFASLLASVKKPATNFLRKSHSPRNTASMAALRNRKQRVELIAKRLKGALRLYSLPAAVALALTALLSSCVSLVESKVFEARAVQNINNIELSSAQDLLHKSLKLDPTNAAAYQHCSQTAERRNKLEKAFTCVSKALDLDPRNESLLTRKADIAVRLGWHQAVVDSYNKLFELKHGTPKEEHLVNRATSLAQLSDYTNALRDYACVLRSNPDNEDANEGIALCYSKLGNDRNAVETLDRVLAKNSNNADAHLLRGYSLQNLKQFDQAHKEFSWVIKQDTQNISAHIALADLLTAQGKTQQGLEELQTAQLLAPSNCNIRLKSADLLLAMNRYEEALAEFKATDKLSNKAENFETLSKRYKACFGAHHDGEAIAILNKLISLRPAQEAFYLDRAKAFAQTKQYSRAIADCDNAFKLNAKNPSTLALRASFNSKLGNEDAALADYTRAVALNPKNVNSQLKLADYQMSQLQFASANETYRQALAIDPKSKPALDGSHRAHLALIELVGNQTKFSQTGSPQTQISNAELDALSFEELLSKGYAALKSNDLSYARAALKKAVHLKPNSPEARRYLAYALMEMKEAAAAEEQLIALKVLGSEDPADQIRLAKAFMDNGDPQRAVPILQHHLRYHNQDVDAVLALTEALLASDDAKAARLVCAQALQNVKNVKDYARLKEKYARLNDNCGNGPQNSGNNESLPASLGS